MSEKKIPPGQSEVRPAATPADAEVAAAEMREKLGPILLSLQASLEQATVAAHAYKKELDAELAQYGLDSPEAIDAAILQFRQADSERWRELAVPQEFAQASSSSGGLKSRPHARI